MKVHHPYWLCGERGDSAEEYDCEACQIVEAVADGSTEKDVADSHAMPVSLVRDVLTSCRRRRAS